MNRVSRDIYMRVPPWVVRAFSWGIPQLKIDRSKSCDHGLDYARTTTTVSDLHSQVLTPEHFQLL